MAQLQLSTKFEKPIFLFWTLKCIWAIPCQSPPELVNWNFLILRQLFHKIFPKTLKFYFQKNFLIIFINYGFFFLWICRIWRYVETNQKYETGSSSLLVPRNNTQSHGIELVLLWNVKVLWDLLKLIIALTVVLFSTRILTFWPWICYEAWRLVTKMSWNHLVASSLG